MKKPPLAGPPFGYDSAALHGFGAEAVAPVPPTHAQFLRSGDWWPGGMGHPNSEGSKNGLRYAYFARACRLAIERAGGVVTLYDTQGHALSGVSPEQTLIGALRFASQFGAVDVASLRVVAR